MYMKSSFCLSVCVCFPSSATLLLAVRTAIYINIYIIIYINIYQNWRFYGFFAKKKLEISLIPVLCIPGVLQGDFTEIINELTSLIQRSFYAQIQVSRTNCDFSKTKQHTMYLNYFGHIIIIGCPLHPIFGKIISETSFITILYSRCYSEPILCLWDHFFRFYKFF